jgi:ATP-dependent DNA ligase
VGKWTRGTYQTDGRSTSWLKIKNPNYSQMVDRHELFDGRRAYHPHRPAALPVSLKLA